MKNKGFVLAETITMTVILLIAFSFIYAAVSSYIIREKRNVFYDDVATIYQAYYIKEALLKYSNINDLKEELIDNKLGLVIGSETPDLFHNTEYFNKVADHLYLYQMYITGNIRDLKECARNPGLKVFQCQSTFMDEELRAFITTINVSYLSDDYLSNYYLIMNFKRTENGNTFSHYTWVIL